MTNYSRGADFERTVKADLEEMGFFVVRSAGSHGAVDLLALSLHDQWAVQCKINGKMTPDERKKLLAVANVCHIKPMKAWRPSRGAIRYEEVKIA
jgi:Holliday junction resolvase